jgi:tetratricopeptide (TPR) repeat protein
VKSNRLKTPRRNLWICAALFAATLLAYLPALRAGFVWDDDGFVTKPELRSLAGLWRIWTDLSSTEQWYPMLHGFFWVQHKLWGDAPMPYHLVNILLHALAACLLGRVLLRLAIPGAWLAAFIFALHPVYAESVAWITEQKNTLSLVFYLASALAYLAYDERRQAALDGKPVPGGTGRLYLVAAGLFTCAALSKSVTATLPPALAVILWWKRGRLDFRRDLAPLVPLLGIGAVIGLATAWVEYHYMGAQGSAFTLNLLERGLLAGRIAWFYPTKLLWPDLIFIYERWQIDAGVWWQWLYPLATLGLLGWLWAIRHRTRAPLAAVLYYGGSLFPTIGFFNVYAFKFSYVADHWQYLPSIGLVVLAAAGLATWGVRFPGALRTGAVVVLAVCAGLTWNQSLGYRDMETFYRTILAKNNDCSLAHNNLGLLLREDGRLDEAARHFREMLRIDPKDADAIGKLAVTYTRLGRPDEAIRQYESALQLKPADASLENDLAAALVAAGRRDEAAPHFERALQLQPDLADASYNYGNLLFNLGRPADAVPHYQAALRAKPDNASAEHNLGAAYLQLKLPEEAALHFTAALRLRPDYFEAHYNLATVLSTQGKFDEAIQQLQAALRLRPDHPAARAALATALTKAGRTK